MSEADQEALEAAAGQLQDCLQMARGVDIDVEECGVTTLDQVDMTREAIQRALRVLTKWRRKAVVQGSGAREEGTKDGDR